MSYEEGPYSRAVITDNVVTNSGTPYPEEVLETGPTDDVESFKGKFFKGRFGGDGIEVGGFDEILVDGNDVSDSVENGLFVSGAQTMAMWSFLIMYSRIMIRVQTFESGLIDLTGDRNTFQWRTYWNAFCPC